MRSPDGRRARSCSGTDGSASFVGDTLGRSLRQAERSAFSCWRAGSKMARPLRPDTNSRPGQLWRYANSGSRVRRLGESTYSALMPAALTIGYHFSTSALWKAAKAAGVNRSGGGTCMPRSAMRLCAWIGHRGESSSVHLGDDVSRRALGRPKTEPSADIDAGKSCLVGGRHLACRRPARVRHHGIDLDVVVAILRQ